MSIVKISKTSILILSLLILSNVGFSQEGIDGRVNTITSAVPFLMIAPDSRAGAMGDVGVATSPDANSQHWNAAKYAFAENDMGVSVSYTPWLRALIGDISLSYLAGYKKIGGQDRSAIGVSLLYFSLGNIAFTDYMGEKIKDHTPAEFAVDVSYSLKLTENLSGAVSARYINSNLTGGISNSGGDAHPGRSVAMDVAAYYQKNMKISDRKSKLSLGVNLSNIGSRISYTDDSELNYIPINMRLGGGFEVALDDYNTISFAFDVNKLLVPTPPIYDIDNNIIEGMDPDVPVAKGVFQSFYDAPGGFKEEMNEISFSAGAEYWYAKQFAVRAGYFYEHENKGNRKFFSIGIGAKLNVFGIDFAYIVPMNYQQSPLANTLRFSLLFDFDGLKKASKPIE